MSYRIPILDHVAAILPSYTYTSQLTVIGINGESGLCCHYNANIFLLRHHYYFLFSSLYARQLRLSKMVPNMSIFVDKNS